MKSFYLLLIPFLLMGNHVQCQNVIKDIDTLQLINISHENSNFPIIVSANKYAENKINTHLQLNELGLIKGHEKKNIFEQFEFNNQGIYGEKSVGYEILFNQTNNLAIYFVDSFSSWINYYNFNPKSGDRYSLSDFFTPENFKQFRERINSIRKESMKKQFDKMQKDNSISDEKKNSLKALEENLYDDIESDNLEDFYFKSDSIYVDDSNLLATVDKGWGLNTINSISIKEINALLNDYGRAALITGKNLEKFHSTTGCQLYEGKMDSKFEFYLLLQLYSEDNVKSVYAYKKDGIAIYLDGSYIDNEYTLKDLDEKYTLNFNKKEDTLYGFLKKKNGKKLSFSAVRK